MPSRDLTSATSGGAVAATSLALCALLLVVLATGCDTEAVGDPDAVVADAAERLAMITTAHVEVTSADLPDEGPVLISASGDAARPSTFIGTLQVRAMGVTADVDVRSVDGEVMARLPFSDELTVVDPGALGISDPATLLDPDLGIAALLRQATDARDLGPQRLDGSVVTRVAVTIAGSVVDRVLASADTSEPFTGVLSVDADGTVRQLGLTGPFHDAAVDTTYTVALSAIDEPIEALDEDG